MTEYTQSSRREVLTVFAIAVSGAAGCGGSSTEPTQEELTPQLYGVKSIDIEYTDTHILGVRLSLTEQAIDDLGHISSTTSDWPSVSDSPVTWNLENRDISEFRITAKSKAYLETVTAGNRSATDGWYWAYEFALKNGQLETTTLGRE